MDDGQKSLSLAEAAGTCSTHISVGNNWSQGETDLRAILRLRTCCIYCTALPHASFHGVELKEIYGRNSNNKDLKLKSVAM